MLFLLYLCTPIINWGSIEISETSIRIEQNHLHIIASYNRRHTDSVQRYRYTSCGEDRAHHHTRMAIGRMDWSG